MTTVRKEIYSVFAPLLLPFLHLGLGSRVYGERPLTWQTTFVCLLQTPNSLPEDKRFDVMTLVGSLIVQSFFRVRLFITTLTGFGYFNQPGGAM